MTEEVSVWSGTPSQVTNLGTFVLTGLFFWLIFPLFVSLWQWLVTKNTKYELTSQRLKTRHGVLNKTMDDLELYRIKDYKLDRPLWLRMFSLGNVILETSDLSHPTVTVRAIRNAEELRETMRKYVEARRDQKRVREIDFQ